MKSNLDVWAIQYYPNELYNALNQIKDGMNLIYSNCISELKIGDKKIRNREFDTFLYNEESEVLIMLMRGGKVTKEELIKYLEYKNKEYCEITFLPPHEEYKDGDNVPELWFSREKSVLEDAIKDSKKKGITGCDYYPLLNGYLSLDYKNKYCNKIEVDGRVFSGIVKFEDKIVLIINQIYNVDKNGKSRNMLVKDVLFSLKKYGLRVNMSLDRKPNLYQENFSKKLTYK